MAHNGFKVVDSDMHVMEPADLWQQYIDPAYRHRPPVGLTRIRFDLGVSDGTRSGGQHGGDHRS
jgi:hypothetical protein